MPANAPAAAPPTQATPLPQPTPTSPLPPPTQPQEIEFIPVCETVEHVMSGQCLAMWEGKENAIAEIVVKMEKEIIGLRAAVPGNNDEQCMYHKEVRVALKAIKQMQGGRKRKTDGGVSALIRLVAGCVPTPRALDGMNEQRRNGIEGNVARRVRKLQEHTRFICTMRERKTRVQHAVRMIAVERRAEEARKRREGKVEAGKQETKKRRKEEKEAKGEVRNGRGR